MGYFHRNASELHPLELIVKANPYHDAQGRFCSRAKAAFFVRPPVAFEARTPPEFVGNGRVKRRKGLENDHSLDAVQQMLEAKAAVADANAPAPKGLRDKILSNATSLQEKIPTWSGLIRSAENSGSLTAAMEKLGFKVKTFVNENINYTATATQPGGLDLFMKRVTDSSGGPENEVAASLALNDMGLDAVSLPITHVPGTKIIFSPNIGTHDNFDGRVPIANAFRAVRGVGEDVAGGLAVAEYLMGDPDKHIKNYMMSGDNLFGTDYTRAGVYDIWGDGNSGYESTLFDVLERGNYSISRQYLSKLLDSAESAIPARFRAAGVFRADGKSSNEGWFMDRLQRMRDVLKVETSDKIPLAKVRLATYVATGSGAPIWYKQVPHYSRNRMYNFGN